MSTLENLTTEQFSLMDSLLQFEYTHRNKSFSKSYLYEQLKSDKEELLYAYRNIKKYIEEVSDDFCVIQIWDSHDYCFVKFNPIETEYLIKIGFKKAIQSYYKSKRESWYNRPLFVAIVGAICGVVLTELVHSVINSRNKKISFGDSSNVHISQPFDK